MRSLRLFVLMTIVMAGIEAQTPLQPLTDADIQSMLEAGLPESTIVMKIQAAVYQGMANLDASSGALVALKAKGATEPVLNTVLWAEPYRAEWEERMAWLQQQEDEQRAAPGLPDRDGVYFKAPSAWTSLTSFFFWEPFYSGLAMMHHSRDYSVPVGDAHAELQIADPQPSFIVRGLSTDEPWQIVRTTAHNNQRQLHLVTGENLGRTDRALSGPPSQLQMTHMAGDIYSLRPTTALTPGEYVLCTGVQGGPGLSQCYTFGIRQ